MSDHDTRNRIEDLAPWPTDESVTAEAICRHLTVTGYAAHCRVSNHPYFRLDPNDPNRKAAVADYLHHVRAVMDRFTAVMALQALSEVDPERAQAVALDIADAVGSGDTPSELLWEWLDGYGIDAEAIVKAVEAERLEASA